MSEDRLEKALEAMRNESANDAELAGAQRRVLQALAAISGEVPQKPSPGETLCAQFQPQFNDYLESRLLDSRRMLMEDHLGRCPHCRKKLAELKGGQTVFEMPRRRLSNARRWKPWAAWAAAAAALFAAVYIVWSVADTALVRGPRAEAVSVEGSLYLVSEGLLSPGASIGENQTVRTGPGSKAVLRLTDGSLVEINERSELTLRAARSGKTILLHSGDIIVQAAKQGRLGGLRVDTRDSSSAVKGTIFAVSAGLAGSRVAVVEGAVAVTLGGSESLLAAGRQTASNPALLGSINEAVAWSGNADEYFSILASLYKIEQELAAYPAEPMRTQSALFDRLPPGTVVYGAVPNISGTLANAAELIKQQSSENPAFGSLWDSESGQALSQVLGRIYILAHLLGDEAVFGLSGNTPEKIPFILAEIQPGRHEEFAFALDAAIGDNISAMPVSFNGSLVMASNSEKNLAWLSANIGRGEQTPFIDEIRARYEQGTGWLLAVNMEEMDSAGAAARNGGFEAAGQLKYIFLEQRSPQGEEENSLTLVFDGERAGPAAFLSESGSSGAAEYLSSDMLAAGFISAREPRRMLDEITALAAGVNPLFAGNAGGESAEAGVQFAEELASAFGTEAAFGIEGISLSGLVWAFAAQVNDPSALDAAVYRFADGVNAYAAVNGGGERLVFEESSSDGREWRSLKSSGNPLSITWTYDRGYIVAASDRGAALRAVAAKNGGGALVWSYEFQRQMAVSPGVNPSAFLWANTRGMFSSLSGLLASNQALGQLLAQKEPALAIFTATPDRIHAASRARISGILVDLILMQGIGRNFYN